MVIKRHPKFREWMDGVDVQTRDIIAASIAKLPFGIGDVKRLTNSTLLELRVHHGPGYRVYFVKRGRQLIVLLAGGTKPTQGRDISMAERRNKEV